MIRPIVGQAHALSNEHVFVVKNKYGNQINVPNSGLDNLGQFYLEDEKYRIPRKELLQMLFLMKCYKRDKAVLLTLFSPSFILQTVKPLLRASFEIGEIVYKPWFNYEEDDVKTLIMKSKMVFTHALFRMIYNLDSNINLDVKNASASRRWNPVWLGDNRQIYKDAVEIMTRQYNDFVVSWGGTNTGGEILDLIDNQSIQAVEEEDIEGEANTTNNPIIVQPLFQLERLDSVFHERRLKVLFSSILNELRQRHDRNYSVNIDEVAKKANEAVFTQTLRDIKKGRIENIINGKYVVDWEVPQDTRLGIYNMNVTSEESVIDLQRKNRQAAAYMLSKVGRVSEELKFFDSNLSVVETLRNGQNVPFEKLKTMIQERTTESIVGMELDLSAKGRIKNGQFEQTEDGQFTRLDHVYKMFVIYCCVPWKVFKTLDARKILIVIGRKEEGLGIYRSRRRNTTC